MNIGELIEFLTDVKEEFGDIKVKLLTNSGDIEQYVQIHGEIK